MCQLHFVAFLLPYSLATQLELPLVSFLTDVFDLDADVSDVTVPLVATLSRTDVASAVLAHTHMGVLLVWHDKQSGLLGRTHNFVLCLIELGGVAADRLDHLLEKCILG